MVRLVALGASNLTRMLPAFVDATRRRTGGRVEVLAAAGFGRSYGARSRFLRRELPGIDRCGLFAALEHAPRAATTTGLVMDVGNDVLYGFPVETIAGWVDAAIVRLRPHVDRLVVAGLPPRIERVGALRFWLLRTFLVPGCPVDREEALRRAAALAAEVERIAARHGARFVPMQPQWYGIDPIHVRSRFWNTAAERLVEVDDGTAGSPARDTTARTPRWQLWRAAPELRWRRGREEHREQPSLRLGDGTSIALY